MLIKNKINIKEKYYLIGMLAGKTKRKINITKYFPVQPAGIMSGCKSLGLL